MVAMALDARHKARRGKLLPLSHATCCIGGGSKQQSRPSGAHLDAGSRRLTLAARRGSTLAWPTLLFAYLTAR